MSQIISDDGMVCRGTAPRTAEDERRDVRAFLRAEARKFAVAVAHPDYADDAPSRDRLASKASLLRTMLAYIERGDHEGAADR